MRSAREQRYGEETDARGAASGRDAMVTAEGLPEWLVPGGPRGGHDRAAPAQPLPAA